MKINYFLLIAFIFALFCENSQAQNQLFIYGKVYTKDEVYTGYIRWGKEEVYWTDLFNSTKRKNHFLKYLNRADTERLRESNRNNSVSTVFGNIKINENWNDGNHNHTFVSYFGDIKEMTIEDDNEVTLKFKNDQRMNLRGGSNDLGTKIYVIDKELGHVSVYWDRLKKIEFMEAPSSADQTFGAPIYGTVETSSGTYSGFIQWDHDERLTSDKLDGDYKDGDVSVPFSQIATIERDGRGCVVQMRSGKSIYLTGSNDVNNENRGIIVSIPEIGRFDIPWRDFYKLDIESVPSDVKQSYNDFPVAKDLVAEIVLITGEKLTGAIAYDLDESFDFEMLDGKLDHIKTYIPFRNIQRIEPKNYSYSNVTLKNGVKLTLGETQDLSDKNDGLLIFTNDDHSRYVKWNEIESIHFQ